MCNTHIIDAYLCVDRNNLSHNFHFKCFNATTSRDRIKFQLLMSKHVDAHERQVRTLSVLLAFKAGSCRSVLPVAVSMYETMHKACENVSI